MGTSTKATRNLTNVLELFKAGMRMPVSVIEQLIAADAGVEPVLIDVLRSRAVDDDSWAPLWTLVVLGERRCARAIPEILGCLERSNEVLRNAIESALLRMGPPAEEPVLHYLKEHEESEARMHLLSVLATIASEKSVAFLIEQFRPESVDYVALGWLLAGCGRSEGVQALEKGLRDFPEPGLAEPLLALHKGEDLRNPLLNDWHTQWTWEEETSSQDSEEEDSEEAQADDTREEGPEFAPRHYDVNCPVCRSHLEFDSHTGESRALERGLQIPKNGPCPCGSRRKFKKCCGKKE